MQKLDKKQIFIGTILGIILSILTFILLTRNIQPLSAQGQQSPQFTVFKTAREGFKFFNINDNRTFVGMQFRDNIPYLATVNATSMLWMAVNTSNPGAGFIVFTNKLNTDQQSWIGFTTSSVDFLMKTPSGINYAPIFAQTPTVNSSPDQVATKFYVDTHPTTLAASIYFVLDAITCYGYPTNPYYYFDTSNPYAYPCKAEVYIYPCSSENQRAFIYIENFSRTEIGTQVSSLRLFWPTSNQYSTSGKVYLLGPISYYPAPKCIDKISSFQISILTNFFETFAILDPQLIMTRNPDTNQISQTIVFTVRWGLGRGSYPSSVKIPVQVSIAGTPLY